MCAKPHVRGANYDGMLAKLVGCELCNLRLVSLVLCNVVAFFAEPHVRGATYDGMLAKFAVSMACSRVGSFTGQQQQRNKQTSSKQTSNNNNHTIMIIITTINDSKEN